MLQKKSARGRVYYACEKGKDCGFMTWDEPIAEKCPQCGSTLFRKKGKNPQVYCAKEGCGYSRQGK